MIRVAGLQKIIASRGNGPRGICNDLRRILGSWPEIACLGSAFVVLVTMYNRAGMSPARHHWFGASMPTLDERVAYIEGRLQEQSQRFDVRFDGLDVRLNGLDAKFDRLDAKVDHLGATVDHLGARVDRLDARFDRLDATFDRLDEKIDGVGQRLDSKLDGIAQRLDSRIDVLDGRASRHFTWLVGIQVAALIAIVTALLR
jgi:uncharacterized protein YdcH (DUF465 family)